MMEERKKYYTILHIPTRMCRANPKLTWEFHTMDMKKTLVYETEQELRRHFLSEREAFVYFLEGEEAFSYLD